MRSAVALAVLLAGSLSFSTGAHAGMDAVRGAYDSGQYFSAARMAFNDLARIQNPSDRAKAYYWITQSLVKAGLDQSAIYFFASALQLRDPTATRLTLELAPFFSGSGRERSDQENPTQTYEERGLFPTRP